MVWRGFASEHPGCVRVDGVASGCVHVDLTLFYAAGQVLLHEAEDRAGTHVCLWVWSVLHYTAGFGLWGCPSMSPRGPNEVTRPPESAAHTLGFQEVGMLHTHVKVTHVLWKGKSSEQRWGEGADGGFLASHQGLCSFYAAPSP